MQRLKAFFAYHAFALGWALFILLLCGLQSDSLPRFSWKLAFSFDKVVHVFFYAMLCLLLIVAQLKFYRYHRGKVHAVRTAILSSISYGILVEGLQAFVFYHRSADMMDVIANSIGSVLGLLLFLMVYGRQALKRN